MNSQGGRVVPFNRPAAYWANRARLYRTPEALPDAARLTRKAWQESGDMLHAQKLAEIDLAMGSYTDALRCLLAAISAEGLTGSACYFIGRCALEFGQEDIAQRAMDACLRLEPGGPHAENAQLYLENYPWESDVTAPRCARGECLARRSRKAREGGDANLAEELAKEAWKKAKTYETALLMGSLSTEGSLGYLLFAAEKNPRDFFLRLTMIRACAALSSKAAARQLLIEAGPLCATLNHVEQFCRTAWQTGDADLALQLLEEQLRTKPVSSDFWRLKYLTLRHMRLQQEAERALETWQELDPESPVAQKYRQFPQDLQLYGEGNAYLRGLDRILSALPCRLQPGPLNRLLHRMVVMLADSVEAQMIYHLLPPLWRRLSPAEKRICDAGEHPSHLLAIALYLMLKSGRQQEAEGLWAAAPGKKRLARLLKRFAQLMKEGE